MTCHEFKKHQLGQLSDAQFEQHLKTCPVCTRLIEQDLALMDLAQTLKTPVPAAGLWDRIESELAPAHRVQPFFQGRVKWVLRVAAVLLLLFSSSWWLINQSRDKTRVLAQSSLRRVERLEAAYAKAIDRLEETVAPKMAEMDLELALLYRDRLAVIDDQITQCREALGDNPGNAHIRRYMLAALQEKQDTLKEMARL